MHSLKDIEGAALSLPAEKRTTLVLKLLDSIDEPDAANDRCAEEAWAAEANRRYEAYLAGEEQLIPAEQVFAELRAEDEA